MRGIYELLIGLIAFCGIIQIILLFLVKPVLYWIFPICAVVVFLLGYMEKIARRIRRKNDRIKFMIFLLIMNSVFFMFIGAVYYMDPTNEFAIGLALISTMLWTMLDFEELGMHLAQHRKKTPSVDKFEY